MNLLNQGDISGSSVPPAKRKRGRPRKDSSLKPAEPAHTPVSEGVKEQVPQRNDRTRGTECIVGQAVTGVVEATFDSGYLLTVRIGNSDLRGIVFKPGHCRPITADNDVAPHVQMIRRSNVLFTAENDRPMTVTVEHTKVEDGKEALKSSTEDSGIGSKQETGGTKESSHLGPVMEPSFDDRAGRMTELLKENVKESTEPDPKNGAGVP